MTIRRMPFFLLFLFLLYITISYADAQSSSTPFSASQSLAVSDAEELDQHAQGMPIASPKQSAVFLPESSGIEASFDGFNFDDNAMEGVEETIFTVNPSGAAGTNQLVAVGHKIIEARNKNGVLLWQDSLKDFFSPLDTEEKYLFSPKVIFDHYENRFVVITLLRVDFYSVPGSESEESRILLAVSKTASPTSATTADWYYHSIDSKILIGEEFKSAWWVDGVRFEVDEEAIYLTGNLWLFDPLAIFGGARLWIVDKGAVGGFYDGGPTTVTVHNPFVDAGYIGATAPTQVYGAGGVGTGIGTFLVGMGSSDGDEHILIMRIDDPLGVLGGPTFTNERVNIGDIHEAAGLPDAPQSGTSTLIEAGDRRVRDAVWRDNALWLTNTILPKAGPDAGETTVHWIKLDTSAVPAGAITLADQGDIGGEDIAPNTFTFFPSLAVNSAGDVTFGFSASAATIFPGAYVTGRQAGDPLGTVRATETVGAGIDSYQWVLGHFSSLWGEYSGMSLDPNDDNLFWAFNQYAEMRNLAASPEDGRWGTAWASYRFETAPFSNLGDRIGVQRGDTWFLDLNGNGQWNDCPQYGGQDACLSNGFGSPNDQPITGDWGGNGTDNFGMFYNGSWFLDFNDNGQWDGCIQDGGQDACLLNSFGVPNDQPIVGDWNGNGTDNVGVFRNGSWFLDFNGNGQWDGCIQDGGQDVCLFDSFGAPNDQPITGDWNGNGTDNVGVFRSGSWFLDLNGNNQWDGCIQDGGQDLCGFFGSAADQPVAGNWNNLELAN